MPSHREEDDADAVVEDSPSEDEANDGVNDDPPEPDCDEEGDDPCIAAVWSHRLQHVACVCA